MMTDHILVMINYNLQEEKNETDISAKEETEKKRTRI